MGSIDKKKPKPLRRYIFYIFYIFFAFCLVIFSRLILTNKNEIVNFLRKLTKFNSRHGREPVLSVGVLSACNNVEKRNAIRQTWAKDARIHQLLFFLGVCRDDFLKLKVRSSKVLFAAIGLMHM
jgi:hypothetical protein